MLALVAGILFVGCGLGQTPATPSAEAMRLIKRGQNDEAIDLLKKAIVKNQPSSTISDRGISSFESDLFFNWKNHKNLC
jgi:hypothetical protein